ncbi:cobyrinate a,c-diamide synthase [Clostridiales bacterium FE2011]|nr:cobyrinate a,c-diamide synthase [Clostridiales bacterium FE2011]QTE73288.1 cobyrinate a,c-diamide synthase [Clostridiales bacterium FE2010]
MRLLIAGTGSSCGKTTASLLLMSVLRRQGLTVAPYKTGPDYIDPGFHRVVCGRPSHNLDSWLMADKTLKRVLRNDADISIIEGVMGYYDGLDPVTLRCSTWELAQKTKTPAILTVDASGGAASVAATVKGFQSLQEENGIAGVLVNRVSGQHHYDLIRTAVEHYTGLPCTGYLTRDQKLELPSRHLGLIPAEETPDLLRRIDEAAVLAEQTLDTSLLLSLAGQAPALPALAETGSAVSFPGYRLGVALDEAFHFYYQDNLDALSRAGMELVFFSPLRDQQLPSGLDGLYIGGGYPEVFASGLSANHGMLRSIRYALSGGLPCYAECGGLMYLGEEIDGVPMVGFLPLRCRMTKRLQRFGYVTVEEKSGLVFPAHEFHHALAEPLENASFAYRIRKASNPENEWICGYEREKTLAAFAHVHFGDRPELIRRFFSGSENV